MAVAVRTHPTRTRASEEPIVNSARWSEKVNKTGAVFLTPGQRSLAAGEQYNLCSGAVSPGTGRKHQNPEHGSRCAA
jgi:hypothetical protein